MSGRSLLLLGGSGFFGKSFLDAYRRRLLAQWSVDRVVVVARSTSSLARTHPELVGSGVVLFDADVTCADDLPAADIVVHAAATTDARNYQHDPKGERANMLAAVDHYARFAERRHRDARVVFASSGAAYGQQPPDLAQLPEDFVGSDVAALVEYKRDYAEAKRLSEDRFAALGAAGVRTAVARCFAFVGRYLPRDQHFAIGNFLADGLAGRPVRVHARRRVYRSYMHADDLVAWLMTIADAASDRCPVYNVGSDEALLMGEVAATVARRFGVDVDAPALGEDGVDRYIPSIAKARAELGLRLGFDLAAAIDDVADRLVREPPQTT